MTTPVKNPTQWRPPTGHGFVVTDEAYQAIVTNTLNKIVDNTTHHYPIVTQASFSEPKFATSWTKTGKNATSYRPSTGTGYVVATGSLALVNKAGLILVNKAGLHLIENPTQVNPKNATIWTQTGQ